MKRSFMKRRPKPRNKGKAAGTRSRVKKGPARDPKHLFKVRLSPCLVCIGWGDIPNEAHHVRCIAPRTMGKRVSDYLTVSLCKRHHAKLHTMNEADFWIVCNVRPAEEIAQFSEEGRQAIAELKRE